jgi:hypothetical protein
MSFLLVAAFRLSAKWKMGPVSQQRAKRANGRVGKVPVGDQFVNMLVDAALKVELFFFPI